MDLGIEFDTLYLKITTENLYLIIKTINLA